MSAPFSPDLSDVDPRVRLAAFAFLTEQSRLHQEVLPRRLLEQGFVFEGRRVPLVGPQGIFKPAVLRDLPLTITTSPVIEGRSCPYEDEVDNQGLIRYRYRGTDPRHHENVGLRRAMERRVCGVAEALSRSKRGAARGPFGSGKNI